MEPILHGTGKQQFYKAMIPSPRSSFEKVFAAINTFDFELLPGFDVIFAPNFSRKNDLSFG
ncbi:MAG TPA: hypothetical protein VFT48_08495 [Pyrinomonadaceae bacterium]|nr:hypothetical protein [Pyrinomonadaceae bacterium]